MKYPRTYHLPQSEGRSSDDKVLKSTNHLVGQQIVITEKMDGENTTGHQSGHVHARSLDSRGHVSRNWVKNFLLPKLHLLPDGWRICGENLYAKHSIEYDNLSGYFLGFSVWNNENQALSWDETEEWFELLEIPIVKVLWRGVCSDSDQLDCIIDNIIGNLDSEKQEGFVIRLERSFEYGDFSKSVAKWVRKNHVHSDKHWMHSEIQCNKLSSMSSMMS